MKYLLICFFSLAVLLRSASAQNLNVKLDSIFTAYELMSLSVVQVCSHQLDAVYVNGYADYDDQVAATAETKFRIASISKAITATCLMQLYEQGAFSLDDDVSDYLGFTLRNPNYPNDSITFRMLLSHTATINDGSKYSQFLSASAGQANAPSVASYFVPGGTYYSNNVFLNKKPGTYFSYSNAVAGLWATLVEAISGERFDQYCRTHLFQPLGLEASFNIQDFDDVCEIGTLYRYIGNAWVPQIDHYNCTKPPAPDFTSYVPGTNGFVFSPQGGCRISAVDLARFLLMLAQNGSYNGITILQDTTAEKMRQLMWQYNGSNGNDYYGLFKAWGLGLQITTNQPAADIVFPDRRMWGHAGEAYGLVSDMYFDSLGNGVVLLISGIKNGYQTGNNSAFYTVESDIFQAVFDDLGNCTVSGTNEVQPTLQTQALLVQQGTAWPVPAGVRQIRILGMHGNLLTTREGKPFPDFPNLPPGVYILMLQGDQQQVVRILVIY